MPNSVSYSFQKGKYGGHVGTIYPFFRTLSTESPLDTEFIEYIPAGYLKCKGQILNADQYPNLATVLGVGASSIYRKEGTTLQERNATTGLGGQIQLPDMGSKYITASSTPGGYLNQLVLNPQTNTEVLRAGVGVSLSSSAQNGVVTFSYVQGSEFVLPETPIPINGSIPVTSSSSTPKSPVFENNILAHGHNTSCATGQLIASNSGFYSQGYNPYYCSGGRTQGVGGTGGAGVTTGLEWSTFQTTSSGSTTGTEHSHSGVFPRVENRNITSRMFRTTIPADSLVTTVRLNTDTTFKLDYIAPKFILCEYLIKF